MGWNRQAKNDRPGLIRCEASNKISYGTRQKAIKALEAVQHQFENGRARRNCQRFYYCSDCGGYHLTSMPLSNL